MMNLTRPTCPTCGESDGVSSLPDGSYYCIKCMGEFSIWRGDSPYGIMISGSENFFSSNVSDVAGTQIPTPVTRETVYKKETFVQYPHTHLEFDLLKSQFNDLSSKLEEFENRLNEYEPKIVVIEEKSKKEAKELIESYFKEHKKADIEELMMNLHISVDTIVEIIDELREEGKLVPRDES